MQIQKLDFPTFLSDCKQLADLIRQANFQPDYLIGLARGGWIPTRIMSSELSVKRILSAGISYTDSSRSTLDAYSLPSPLPSDSQLLIVEDCLESGRSLERAVEIFSPNNVVMTASLYTTEKTDFFSDFFVSKLSEPPIFPWE